MRVTDDKMDVLTVVMSLQFASVLTAVVFARTVPLFPEVVGIYSQVPLAHCLNSD